MQVFPVVNCLDFESVNERVGIASRFLKAGDWIHIDIADGKFTVAPTWNNPEEFKELRKRFHSVHFEIHLMVEDPEAQIDAWLRYGAKRIVVQMESMTDSIYILHKCKKFEAEAVLSSGPRSEPERLLAHQNDFKHFQVLAVYPGPSGQKFQHQALDKIRFLRSHYPESVIEVDGGITEETAHLARKAGADIVVSASYIFSSKDPAGAYRKLLAA